MTDADPGKNRHEPVPTPLRRLKRAIPSPVKATGRTLTRQAAVLSAGLRTEPDFLIIGTKRGGTTTLWNAVLEHPDVLPMVPRVQEIKSPHYFDINYWRGPYWYRSHFPSRFYRRLHQSRTGYAPLCGEASPYYMFHPLAAERIRAELPQVRLVVSLRNPIDRIWSHYRERVGSNTEDLSFAEALAAEPGRLAGEEDRIRAEQPHYYSRHHDLSSFLARGHYAPQLRRYFDLFPADQILVLRAEDFYQDSAAELRKVFDFVGLRSGVPLTVRRYNRLPRSAMSAEDRARLRDYYADSVRDTESLLGRSMNWADFPS